MSNKLWTRREFLRTAALGAAGVTIVACQPKTVIVKETVEVEKEVEKVVKETVVVEKEVEVEKEVTKIIEKEVQVTVAAEELKEAPDLYAQVAQGKLAPVSERIPLEPRVVQVVEEIGQYGGTWRRVAIGPGDVNSWSHRLSYDCPLRYGPDGAVIEPHIIKGFEPNEDGSEFTFFLRKGHRWSDGEPFTADDLMFWYEDWRLDEELAGGIPSWMAVAGEDGTMEKVDDYTVKYTFVAPFGLFIPLMASTRYWDWAGTPKYYLSQFHPKYTDRATVEAMATDEGFDDWMGLWNNRRRWQNTEIPCLRTWVGVRLPPDVPCSMERNPYYFLMDPEGNQLPYIDRLRMEVVENVDVLNLKAIAGAVDHQFRHLSWENYPLFIENAEQGDFRVVQWTLAEGSHVTFCPNMNHEDPGIAELMQNKTFRHALSVALDREEMNEVIFMSLGTPRQASVVPSFPAYKESQSTAYAQYDPDLANELLDSIGMTERDEEGFRKRLDGEKLTINCEYAPVFGPWADVVEMAANYWVDIGIRVFPKEESRDLFDERGNAGTVQDMTVWMQDRAAHFWLDPIWQYPIRGGTPASSGALWYDWYRNNGEIGEEPPPEVQKAYDLYEAIKGATSDEELIALATELLDHVAEELWYIGTVGLLPHVGVVKNNFRNVSEEGVISDWLCLTPGNDTIEQYFFRS
jgi:peptide/nickel transport system substrate-binding protein